MTVITVNKVQSIYNTPVYKFAGISSLSTINQKSTTVEEESKNEEEACLLQMNSLYKQNQ